MLAVQNAEIINLGFVHTTYFSLPWSCSMFHSVVHYLLYLGWPTGISYYQTQIYHLVCACGKCLTGLMTVRWSPT